MGISKFIMTHSPTSVGSLVRNWSKIFLNYKPHESVREAMELTLLTYLKSGTSSGLIKQMRTDIDYERLIDGCDECLAMFMLLLVSLSEQMSKAISMGGSIAKDALEVIYDQACKTAPRFVKNTKSEFLMRIS